MAEFGYHPVPGVNNSTENPDFVIGCIATCPSPGLATSISCYLNNPSGSPAQITFGIYKASDLSLVGRTGNVNVPGGAKDWFTGNIVSGGLLLAAQYYLCFQFSNTPFYIYGEAVGSNIGYESVPWGNPWPDPWVPTSNGVFTYDLYCTYTPSGLAIPSNVGRVAAMMAH